MLRKAVLFLLLAVTPALADDAATDAAVENLLGDPAPYHEFFDRLQAGIADGDAEAVAAMIAYPITVSTNGEVYDIPDAETFAANYDALITPPIADAMAAQAWGALFVNADGLMVGNGEIWINGTCATESCTDFVPLVVTIQEVGEN